MQKLPSDAGRSPCDQKEHDEEDATAAHTSQIMKCFLQDGPAKGDGVIFTQHTHVFLLIDLGGVVHRYRWMSSHHGVLNYSWDDPDLVTDAYFLETERHDKAPTIKISCTPANTGEQVGGSSHPSTDRDKSATSNLAYSPA